MAAEIITLEDLEKFRIRLLNDLKEVIDAEKKQAQKKWLRSHEVRKLLGISTGTLQNLSVNGTLNPSKIGGSNYYRYEEIEKMFHNEAGRKR